MSARRVCNYKVWYAENSESWQATIGQILETGSQPCSFEQFWRIRGAPDSTVLHLLLMTAAHLQLISTAKIVCRYL